MIPGQLSDKTASSLGRNLQVLMKDQFSEGFLNRVLRLIIYHPDKRNYRNLILPPDTVICPYEMSLHSPPGLNDFIEYKKDLDRKFEGKSYVIMLAFKTAAPASENLKDSAEPEVLFRLLESLVFCIENGVLILKFEQPDHRNQDLPAGQSSENHLHNIIISIAHEINPSVYILTDVNHVQNDQQILAEMKKFLGSNNQVR